MSVFSGDIRVVFASNPFNSIFYFSLSTSGSRHQTLSDTSHSIVHVKVFNTHLSQDDHMQQ